ncbi:hypothetical protein ITP53_10900 [Nonomuraea sp. K274]|uniref:Uncharacterized protein n=1 Tax=Nonomuraea cypriaca TaxID=1187855 RepID=A0A931EW19_9ACTN|nr:hypothetical protein [Nonomuraea cypriaca]MBF8186244.1 hypothetical protein [Nonomuraea cypriaca]
MPEPSLLETVVWDSAAWAVTLLPLVLALLALWVPRWFPVLGAFVATVVLVLTVLTIVVPYTGICGRQQGEWLLSACVAVVVIALLLARRERAHLVPRMTAAIWSVVLIILFGRMVVATMPVSSGDDLGCWMSLQGVWALAQMHLFTVEAVGVWVGVAAVGAVLTGGRAAPVASLMLLIPALFEPVAQVVSSAPHDCSGLLALITWPYLVAAVLGVAVRSSLMWPIPG